VCVDFYTADYPAMTHMLMQTDIVQSRRCGRKSGACQMPFSLLTPMASWRSVWRVMFSKKYPIARRMDSMSPMGVMTPSSTRARMTPLVSFLQGAKTALWCVVLSWNVKVLQECANSTATCRICTDDAVGVLPARCDTTVPTQPQRIVSVPWPPYSDWDAGQVCS
jgi:hypothetical protein